MYGLKSMLDQEKLHLEDIILKATRELENAPEGYLRISRDKERTRYYHCLDDRNGVYIPKENEQLPRQLAQKTYIHAVIKKAKKELEQITHFLQHYDENSIEEIYQCSHAERQKLIVPIEPTLDQLIKRWYEEPYKGKEFQEGTAVIMTEHGERVRSKSEKILADYFFRKGILYLYEKPLLLQGYGVVYPDFTFYSPKLGKEIYWEHEGMMDKMEYARYAVKKLNSYQMNGIFPGERLILSFETEQEVLNTKLISELVERYLVFN